jgi:hypothetical protein
MIGTASVKDCRDDDLADLSRRSVTATPSAPIHNARGFAVADLGGVEPLPPQFEGIS